jgi:hypothetical protein
MADHVASTPLVLSNPALGPILQHLCASDCHAFGSVRQWCETRGDCVYAIVCPDCQQQFLIEETDLADLERWTDANGYLQACGVRFQDG